jgi:DNA-binding transcriptional LysR family regulator
MIRPAEFAELTAFAAVAQARSFRRAADALKLQPSTLSHSVRALEERLGIRLLARTTRSVAPTEAGHALLALIAPALSTLDGAGEAISSHRLQPRGTVRLTIPQGAAMSILAPKLGAFAEAYPDVTLDVSVDDGFTDIVNDGIDAGIRLGESVADGMTAVRVSADRSAAVVASPTYWASRPPPETPRELGRHLCINRRYAVDRGIYRWRFVRGDEEVAIACEGPLIVNSEQVMQRAALDGVGVAMLAEGDVADDIRAGRLVRVLQDWCPPIFGFFLYHPSHRLPSASLTALIETLRVGRCG